MTRIILPQADGGVRGNLRSAEKAEAEVHQDESEGHPKGKVIKIYLCLLSNTNKVSLRKKESSICVHIYQGLQGPRLGLANG
jgi:hypothetical protein